MKGRGRSLAASPRAHRARAGWFEVLEPRTLLSTFTVNTTADENDANKVPGELSLREAIIQSNATPGHNTIIVPAGTYKLMIPGSGETAGQTGDLDITNSVTIQGAGSGSTIIDGNQLDRVLNVLGSGSNVPTVSITGVTIQNGLSPNTTSFGPGNGGGIEVSVASLTLNQCVVQNNKTGTTGSYGGAGGGIDVTQGTLTVTSSTITGNSTGSGSTLGGDGGVSGEFGAISLTGCTISNNATGNGSSNVSAGRGGGVYSDGSQSSPSPLKISNSVITGNVSGSASSEGEGGGIYNYVGSILSLDGTTVANNTASLNGGGVMNDNGTTDHITNCTVDNNTAEGIPSGFYGGGGILNTSGTINLISGTTIAGNMVLNDSGAYYGGGGIYNIGQIGTIVNCTIQGNAINVGDGGGILNDGTISNIINTTIAGNGAPRGGGLSNESIATMGQLTNTLLAGNSAGTGSDFQSDGALTSATYNLVQSPNGHSLTNGVNGNIVGLDPLLGVLANNGGPTQTMSLLFGSPAINAGTSVGAPSTDQRGLPRPGPGNSGIDIGAFEVQGTSDHPPVASNQSVSTRINTALNGKVSATDADGNPLTYSVHASPAHGSLALQSSGSFTYTPAANYGGPDSFTFRAFDGQAYSNIATVSITVSAPPTANNDSYATPENASLSVIAPGVLAKDTDPNNLPLSALLVAGPAHGSLTFNANGSFTYNPTTNYFGFDSFTYQASDGSTTSNVATVTLTVGQPPVANNDSYSTAENTALSVAAPGVLGNDTDPNNAPLTAALVAGPAHGSLTLNANGSFTYNPTANFLGVDSFTYQASDGKFTSGVATVSLTVGQPPVARADAYTVDENSSLAAGAGATFVMMVSQAGDYIGQGLTYDFTPANSTITGRVLSGGVYTNAVELDVSVSGQFWTLDFAAPNYARLGPGTYLNATRWPFQAAAVPGLDVSGDGRGSNTLTGQFTVTQASYDASGNLVAFAASFVQHSEGSQPALVSQVAFQSTTSPPGGVLTNDTDMDPGTTLTATLVGNPGHGMVAFNPDGSFLYTPTPGYTGTDSFTYRASDGDFQSNLATVTLNVVAPPTANNDRYTVAENTALAVAKPGVLGNDTDPGHSPMTPILVSGPSHGSLVLNGDGSFTYRPATSFIGTDSFTYEVDDGMTVSGAATVTLTVVPASQATLIKSDTTTQGTWIGTYGAQGYDVINSSASLPSYATITPSGQSKYTWASSTTDVRALQVAGGSSRIAACWYSGSTFTVDVDLADGQQHRLELYFLDWDGTSRAEQVQISDAASGAVLSTQTISSFHSGLYLDYTVSGNILIKFTRQAGANAVLSGLFLDPMSGSMAGIGGLTSIGPDGRSAVQASAGAPASPLALGALNVGGPAASPEGASLGPRAAARIGAPGTPASTVPVPLTARGPHPDGDILRSAGDRFAR